MKNILFFILMAATLIFGLSSSAAASSASEPGLAFDGIGVVLGSYHFNNDGSHAWRTPTSHYNEYNPGLTAFFKVNGVPLVDEAGITYITKNSYGVPSIYVSAYHKLFNMGPVEFELAAAVATGYNHKVDFADRFDGLLPLAGITMVIFRHVEVDIIPAGYIAGNSVANELFFSLRFTGL